MSRKSEAKVLPNEPAITATASNPKYYDQFGQMNDLGRETSNFSSGNYMARKHDADKDYNGVASEDDEEY